MIRATGFVGFNQRERERERERESCRFYLISRVHISRANGESIRKEQKKESGKRQRQLVACRRSERSEEVMTN